MIQCDLMSSLSYTDEHESELKLYINVCMIKCKLCFID